MAYIYEGAIKSKEGDTMNRSMDIQAKMIADEQIIELYWQRDEIAIRETAAKYGDMLFRIAYNILHDKADCEECQNDTYLCIWNRIPPTRPTAFRAFIAKIVRDIAINKYNAKSSKKRIPSELTISLDELCYVLHSDNSPDKEYLVGELSEIISDYVRGLSKRRHYIFIGRFYFGNTLEQIAADLGISAATVQRDIVKLKQGLKTYLERKGVYI